MWNLILHYEDKSTSPLAAKDWWWLQSRMDCFLKILQVALDPVYAASTENLMNICLEEGFFLHC